MKRKALQIMFAVTALSMFTLCPRIVTATGNLDLGEIVLYPPLLSQLNIQPGEGWKNTFTVKNSTDIPLDINVLKAEYNYETGAIVLPNENYNGCANWIVLETNTAILPAQSEKEINFELVVPAQTPTGVYIPIIYIQYDAAGAQHDYDTTGTDVEGSPSFKLKLNVTGTTNPQIQITTLKTANPVIATKPTIEFSLTNTSQVFLRPLLRLQVISPTNERIYDQTINAELHLLYPGETIAQKVILESLDISAASSLGSYQVELLAQDLQFGSSDIQKVGFFFLPLSVLILALAALGIGIMILIIITRKKDSD